jgi:hypothetical protein
MERCWVLAAAAAAGICCCCLIVCCICSRVGADGPACGCDDAGAVLRTHQQALARLGNRLQHQQVDTAAMGSVQQLGKDMHNNRFQG